MIAGSIEIQLMAEMAQLRKDMNEGMSIVQAGSKKMQEYADLAKNALLGLGAGLSIKAMMDWVAGVIEGTGALHDMAIQTGMSAQALSQFKSLGAYTETSLEQISGASLKLAKNLALTDEEGKGAALAIKALGLDFNDFKKLAPEQQMIAVARAMGDFEDGSDKSAAAMLMFGKEGAKMLPFLKDLGENADEISGKLSAQEVETRRLQAAMSDAYGDNLTKIRKESDGWKKDMAMGLLPAMYETTEAMLAMERGTGGIRAKISDLAKDGTLADWARGGATAISYLVDIGQGLFSLFPMIGKAIAGVAAGAVELFGGMGTAVRQFIEGDYSKSMDTMKAAFRAVDTIGAAAASDIAAIWNQKLIGQTFRDAMAGVKGVGIAAEDAKKHLDLSSELARTEAAQKAATEAAKRAAAEEKKQADQLKALVGEVNNYTTKLLLEQQQTEKLSDGQKLALKVMEALRDGKIKGTEADRQALAQQLQNMLAEEKESELNRRNKELTEAYTKARNEAVGAMRQQTATLQDQVRQQEEENLKLTMSAEAWALVEIARIRAAAASRTASADFLEEHEQLGAETDELREQAKALNKLADLKEQGIHLKAAKESAEEWKKTTDSIYNGLTDSLYRAFESGKGFFQTLWEGIKNTFKTTVLKLAVQAIMSPIANAIGNSLMGSVGTAAAGSAGGSMLGSLLGGTIGGLGAFGGALGSGFSMAMGGGMGLALEGGAAMMGSATGLSSMLAGMGQIIGALGPIALGLGAVYAIAKALDNGGTPHRGAMYVSDSKGGYVPGANVVGDMAWGDSVYRNHDQSVEDALKLLTGGGAAALNALSLAFGGQGNYKVGGYWSADGHDASQGNTRVWAGDTILSSTSSHFAVDAKQGLTEYTAELAGQVRLAMGTIDLPTWAKDQLNALGTGASMEDLLKTVQAIGATQLALKQLGDVFAPLGGVFGRIAGLSGDATMQLAQFAGGIDQLLAKTQSYVQGYYSEGEQVSMQAANIRKVLDAAGLTGDLSSKEQLRALMETRAEKTEEGRKQIASLLEVAGSFANVAEYIQKMGGGSLDSLAASAPGMSLLQSQVDQQAAQVDAAQQTVTAVNTVNSSILGVQQAITSGLALVTSRLESLATATANNARDIADALAATPRAQP